MGYASPLTYSIFFDLDIFWLDLILATFLGTPSFDLDFHAENDVPGQNGLDFWNQRVEIDQRSLFWHDPVEKNSTVYDFFKVRISNCTCCKNLIFSGLRTSCRADFEWVC